MPTLADIYSAINTAKRKGSDFIQNPGTSLQQMLGNANDRARALNEQDRAATDEFLATGRLNGPKQMQSAMDLAGAYNPVGIINQPIKGSKLVNIPIDMVEHGEAAMPGGTLSWPTAKEKIQDYATRKTEIPPIDIVSPEGGAGKWMVADGSHRLEAARLKGQSTIPAYVSPHDKEGLDLIKKMKMNAYEMNGAEMKMFKTSDGYTFYELPNGKIVDNLDPKAVDMSWDNFKQLKDDFGDDVYQVSDELGKRKAAVSSTGNANFLNDWYGYRAEPTSDELFQQALNKQNTKKQPNLKLVK